MAKSTHLYANSLRGLGRITMRELKALLGESVETSRAGTAPGGYTRGVDIVPFTYSGTPRELLQIGTTEDIFASVLNTQLTGDRDKDLPLLRDIGRERRLPIAVEYAKHFRGRPSKRIRYRAVVQASDADWRGYRRNEMQQALEKGIARAYPKWKAIDDNADFEFWLQQTDREATVGIRLSDAEMRHRTYKVAHKPGSLKPTVARAMAFLSRPEDSDIVVDPVCGQGTVLIERAVHSRYGMLVGGDKDVESTIAAMENFGRRHRPRAICEWNAEQLPLPDESAHVILANLPWGHRIPARIEQHYAAVLRETERVLKPRGRAVFLTDQSRDLKSQIDRSEVLYEIERITRIAILGRSADIFVLQKM